MSIRAAYFDLGGVILRTEYQAPREQLAERLNMTYEDLNKIVFESESARLASIGKITTEQHWETVIRKLGRPASEVGPIREQFFAGDVLDRDLIGYIRELRPDRRTGLISNGWPDLREYLLQNHFEDAFDTVVISAEVGLLKPDPAIYRLALQNLQVRANEAVFVDDTAANIEAARSLGMQAIHFQDAQRALIGLSTLLK